MNIILKLVFITIGLTIISFVEGILISEVSRLDLEISFQSRGAKLHGKVLLPQGTRPIALLVAVHGAGTAEYMLPVSRLLAAEGFAVLYYDKRGVGRSEGTYVHIENTTAENLELLAVDAAAAFKAVKEHPQFIDLPVGYIGISQAGWVIPIASQISNPDFIALWGGPVCTTSEEHHFSNFTEDNPDFWDSHSKYDVLNHMQTVQYASDDVDPSESLRNLSIPGLWLFGGQDASIPVDLSISRLEELKRNGKRQFEYQIFPNEGHNLADSPRQESFQAMVKWLKKIIEETE